MLTCCALILNHNGRHLLRPLYDSLSSQSGLTAICLIDNASTDDSIKFTEQNYPNVEIIQNKENFNFGTAYNRAIRSRSEDVALLLNNDVVVHPESVQNALTFLEGHPDVASVSFEGLDPLRNGAYGGVCPPLRRFGKELSPARSFHAANDPALDSPCYLWGAACCIRRDVFLRVQFDERMDWGFEDVDLGWSIRRQTGMRNVFLPGATIFHLDSHTTRKRFRGTDIHRMITRNAILSFTKNATRKELLRALPYLIVNLFRYPGHLKATWDLLRRLPHEVTN